MQVRTNGKGLSIGTSGDVMQQQGHVYNATNITVNHERMMGWKTQSVDRVQKQKFGNTELLLKYVKMYYNKKFCIFGNDHRLMYMSNNYTISPMPPAGTHIYDFFQWVGLHLDIQELFDCLMGALVGREESFADVFCPMNNTIYTHKVMPIENGGALIVLYGEETDTQRRKYDGEQLHVSTGAGDQQHAR